MRLLREASEAPRWGGGARGLDLCILHPQSAVAAAGCQLQPRRAEQRKHCIINATRSAAHARRQLQRILKRAAAPQV